MKIETVGEARIAIAAAKQVMMDALEAPTGKTGGRLTYDEEGRSAAEILGRRLPISDELAQALLDALEVTE